MPTPAHSDTLTLTHILTAQMCTQERSQVPTNTRFLITLSHEHTHTCECTPSLRSHQHVHTHTGIHTQLSHTHVHTRWALPSDEQVGRVGGARSVSLSLLSGICDPLLPPVHFLKGFEMV